MDLSAPPTSTAAVLDFWFGLDPERHWQRDDALDAAITKHFARIWDKEQCRPAGFFLADPQTALAAVILFDQFPRNMFRGQSRAFATDTLARDIAAIAVDRGFDAALPEERRHFAYMPFEHSESLADQDRSVALFERLGNERYLDFARKHRDVIVRFGRFPHRNTVLGRVSTPDEMAFDLESAW